MGGIPRSRAAWRRRHCSARASLRAAKLSARGTGTRKFRRMKPTSPLDLALVVALARPAEPVLEQIVGLKLREDARSLPLPIAQDPGNRQLGVVVQDGSGDAAEEGNRRVVAIAERVAPINPICRRNPSIPGLCRIASPTCARPFELSLPWSVRLSSAARRCILRTLPCDSSLPP